MPSTGLTRSLSWLLLLALTLSPAGPAFASSPRPKQLESGAVTLTNEYLTLTLYGEGVFSLATADGRHLLYPGSTSYLSLRVDDTVYSAEQENLQPLGAPTPIDGTNAQESFAAVEGVQFTLSYALMGDAVRLTIRARNTSGQDHLAGARFLLDTQVDQNDGSPLWVNGRVYTRETELQPPFTTLKGYDQIPDPTFTSTCTFSSLPARVLFAHWPTAHTQPWDYTPDETLSFYTPGELSSPLSDSAVLIYYGLGTLPSGGVSEATLFYGLATPQAATGVDALLVELERTEAAAHMRLEADLARLTAVQARAYQVILTSHDPQQWINSLVDSTAWAAAYYSILSQGDPSRAISRIGTELIDSVLASFDRDTLDQLRSMMPALYADLGLAPDYPDLEARIEEVITRELGVQERHQQVSSAYSALAAELRASGLPPDFPLKSVLGALRAYRGQLEATAQHEGLLMWPDPDSGAVAFQLTGFLEKHIRLAEGLRSLEGTAHGFRTFGFWLAAGTTAKIVVAILTGGISVPLELIVATTGASVGFATGASGREMEIINDRTHAFLALHSSLAAGQEMDLVRSSALDVARAVREAGQAPAAWNPRVEIVDLLLEDAQLRPASPMGAASGQVTLRNSGQDPLPVAIFGALMAPTGAGLSPIGVLGRPSPMAINAGQETAISFDFSAPDSRLWGTASPYSVDLWVGAGYRALHVNTDPRFAARLNVAAATDRASEVLAQRQVSLVSTGLLSENESSRSHFTIHPGSSVTTLELSYGSDFDLHLYDARGAHVGINYDTGEIEAEIPGISYSGPSARPEWMRIEGHAGERFENEIIAIQVDEPQVFTLVGSELPALPSLLGIDPVTLVVPTQEPSEGISAQIALYEFGGQSGVSAIEVTSADLVGQSGSEIPASALRFDFPDALGPGEMDVGQLTLAVDESLPEGDYVGVVEVTGTDETSGAPVSSTTQITVRIRSMVAPPSTASPNVGAGIGVVLAIIAIGGTALAVYAAQVRQRVGAASGANTRPAFLAGPHGEHRPLAMQEVLVGRGSGCHVVVDNRTVSRRHARLRRFRGAWYLQNLAGAGRTLVNGQAVEATRLHHGDRITIGATTWTFHETER